MSCGDTPTRKTSSCSACVVHLLCSLHALPSTHPSLASISPFIPSSRSPFPFRVHAQLYKFESTGGSVAGGVALTIAKGIARRLSSPAGPRPKSRGHGRISSFEGGLSTLPKAMAARLGESVHLDAPVLSIAREGALYRLRYGGSVPREVLVRSVVSTLPTAAIATLLEDVVPKAADALRRVRYAPLAVGVLSYPSEDLVDARTDDDGVLVGFGQLHPRSQGLGTLGILYGSSLFEGRAPRGRNVVLAFIGGTPSPAKVTLPDAELVAMVRKGAERKSRAEEGSGGVEQSAMVLVEGSRGSDQASGVATCGMKTTEMLSKRWK